MNKIEYRYSRDNKIKSKIRIFFVFVSKRKKIIISSSMECYCHTYSFNKANIAKDANRKNHRDLLCCSSVFDEKIVRISIPFYEIRTHGKDLYLRR
jgi:hypothetical protein